MKLSRTVLYTAIAAASLGIVACSSSTTPSDSGTGELTSVGRITGFGSVFVGGVEYETNQTTVTKDGRPALNGDDDLKVGMIVTVRGSANGTQGVATSIEFNDELEGLVQTNDLATGGILKVMGQNITVDANTNFESKDPAIGVVENIPPGAIVEVSGYPDGNGSILASYIELKAKDMAFYDDDMEVKGIVKNLSSTTDPLSLTFQLGGVTVDATAIADVIDLGVPLADGLYVEVESKAGFDAANGYLIASEIELEDEGHYGMDGDHGDDMEVEGLITAINLENGTFEINGISVIIPENLNISQFAIGDLVEVELSIDTDGKAVMREIEKEDAHDDDEDFSIEAYVDAIDPDNATITVLGKVIHVDRFNAIMVDKSDDPDKYFSIDTLRIGDFVEVEYYIDSEGSYIAAKVERETPDSHDS